MSQALRHPLKWLASMHFDRKQYQQALRVACEYLRATGYLEVHIGPESVVLKPSRNVDITPDTVRMMLIAAKAEEMRGHARVAAQLDEVAKKLYVAVNGIENGYVSMVAKHGGS